MDTNLLGNECKGSEYYTLSVAVSTVVETLTSGFSLAVSWQLRPTLHSILGGKAVFKTFFTREHFGAISTTSLSLF